MYKYLKYGLIFFALACQNKQLPDKIIKPQSTSLIVLGTIQDGGSPHIGCKKECCINLFENPDSDRQVVSLGLYNSENNKKYLFEATPDLTR